MKTLQERFDEKWILDPSSGCWLWTAQVDKYGYGRISINNESTLAHRVSYQIHRGQIPKKAHVLHHCDTPPCVNPSCLFLGDAAINQADKVDKGRQLKGGNIHNSILIPSDIQAIRLDQRLQREIAVDYGVHRRTISDVKKNKTWKHI